MATRTIQPSFAGGELAPSLHARVDLAKYAVGLKRLLNMFVHAHGGVSNRAGLEYLGDAKGQDAAVATRLVPFQFSTLQAYVLEFGDGVMRVWKDGGLVVYPSGHPDVGAIVEVVSPYPASALPLLKFVQTADVMTLVHPDYAPRELSRTDHHAWAFSAISFAPPLAAPTGVVATPTQATIPPNTVDDYQAQDYKYKVTAIQADGQESLPSAMAGCVNDLRQKGAFNTVTWTAVSGAVKYWVYKERGGLYGYVGVVEAADLAAGFKDENFSPDFSVGPPEAKDPFVGANNYPGAVCFYQQRRGFAATRARPQTIWLTQPGNYRNLAGSIPTKEDDGIEFTLVAQQVNEVRHFVPLNKLIVLTSGGEYVAEGDGGVLTPASIQVTPQGARGCSHVPPLLIGNSVLFVQDRGAIVRDLGYRFEQDAFTGDDLTLLAEHIFRGKTIKEWAYCQAPYSIVWVVFSDGTLASLTYLREQDVFAWSRHQTAGQVESVCSIAEGAEDVPYFTVLRTVGGVRRRYVERLHTRLFTDLEDAFFVDSGLTYDVPLAVTALAGGVSTTLTVPGHGLANGALVDVSLSLLAADGTPSTVKRRGKVSAATATGFTLVGEEGEDVATAGTLVSGAVRACVTTLSGLSHLEGMAVVALGNGSVYDGLTVSGGAVTLPEPVSRAHVGLAYAWEFQTLDLDLGTANGTGQGALKKVNRVTVRTENTRGVFVGPALDRLTEYKPRSTEPYGQPARAVTGDMDLTLEPQYQTSGSVAMRGPYPLPATILAVVPWVSSGSPG